MKELIKNCRLEFVCNSFAELAELHTTKSEIRTLLDWNGPDKAKRLKQLLRDWPWFNVGDIVWAMSSSPIPDNLIGETEDGTWVNGLNRNILIDLINMKQRVDGQSYKKLSSKTFNLNSQLIRYPNAKNRKYLIHTLLRLGNNDVIFKNFAVNIF